MEAAAKFLIAFSVVMNTSYIGAWLYVFNMFNTYTERIDQFFKFIPFGFSIVLLNVGIYSMTILSFFLLSAMKNQRVWQLAIPVQLAFISFFLWQSM